MSTSFDTLEEAIAACEKKDDYNGVMLIPETKPDTKKIDKKELKVKEISDILQREIQPTLEKLATERQNYLKWASLNNEVEKLHRFVTASEYVGYEWSVPSR